MMKRTTGIPYSEPYPALHPAKFYPATSSSFEISQGVRHRHFQAYFHSHNCTKMWLCACFSYFWIWYHVLLLFALLQQHRHPRCPGSAEAGPIHQKHMTLLWFPHHLLGVLGYVILWRDWGYLIQHSYQTALGFLGELDPSLPPSASSQSWETHCKLMILCFASRRQETFCRHVEQAAIWRRHSPALWTIRSHRRMHSAQRAWWQQQRSVWYSLSISGWELELDLFLKPLHNSNYNLVSKWFSFLSIPRRTLWIVVWQGSWNFFIWKSKKGLFICIHLSICKQVF